MDFRGFQPVQNRDSSGDVGDVSHFGRGLTDLERDELRATADSDHWVRNNVDVKGAQLRSLWGCDRRAALTAS